MRLCRLTPDHQIGHALVVRPYKLQLGCFVVIEVKIFGRRAKVLNNIS
jgi:hypothetical protein